MNSNKTPFIPYNSFYNWAKKASIKYSTSISSWNFKYLLDNLIGITFNKIDKILFSNFCYEKSKELTKLWKYYEALNLINEAIFLNWKNVHLYLQKIIVLDFLWREEEVKRFICKLILEEEDSNLLDELAWILYFAWFFDEANSLQEAISNEI
jgi:hypothetical protein